MRLLWYGSHLVGDVGMTVVALFYVPSCDKGLAKDGAQ